MLGIKAKHFTVRVLFAAVPRWAVWIWRKLGLWDGGIVGRWAEEHHEILSQRDPVWSRFQVEWATATAKSGG
jgi:hypothetical protein